MSEQRTVADLIWNNLLEPAFDASVEDRIKQLTCGCMVTCDGDYLDLYIWTGTTGQCDQEFAHDLILAYRPFADGDYSPEERSALLEAVQTYTDGWQDEREPTLEMFRTATGQQ